MNLLSIGDFSRNEIINILDKADVYLNKIQNKEKIEPLLDGKIVLNAFFENSTRTRISFEVAALRLGAKVINFGSDGSSLKKGETVIDTLQTLNMMHPDFFIVRAKNNDMPELATKYIDCSILNAGNGTKSHPTQALLDALALRQKIKNIEGLTIAICGDVRHSRVAGSNIAMWKKMGAEIRLVGPDYLLPKQSDINLYTDIEAGIAGADVVMMLRVQKERMDDSIWLDEHAYFKNYGLTHDRLKKYAPNAVVLHPGPMNRGVEISSEVADDVNISLILNQVEAGVAMRMACLDMCL